MDLKSFFEGCPKAAVAVSGGTDSAFLLYMAKKYAKEVSAWYFMTPFQMLSESDDTRKLCSELGIRLHIVKENILRRPEVVKNDNQRCYYCKYYMFKNLKQEASAAGFEVVLEGTNASDQPEGRPGYRALQELGILSPLRECGLTKEEIRKESEKLGLFTAGKPSNSCLATRVPQGMQITYPLLQRVEQCEKILEQSGFSDLRVRIVEITDGFAAKIQLRQEQMERMLEYYHTVTEQFSMYFQEVWLDLKPREESD